MKCPQCYATHPDPAPDRCSCGLRLTPPTPPPLPRQAPADPVNPETLVEGDVCPTCHQRIRKQNRHRMDKAKCEVLAAMGHLHARGHTWVRISEGRELRAGDDSVSTAYRASQHVSRLKWFGLVEHRGRRTGEYRVTEDGYAFMAGQLRVPASIYCRDGAVEDQSPETVGVTEAEGVILTREYWDNYASEQRDAPRGR